ncbi:YqjK family protein (plasmid) [Escherichia coli]|nr:YqjK family protein [Escherichia coli]WNK06619.1 YqjK family protein [Escherichia coli]
MLKTDWLRITAPVDRGWQTLYQWRNVIVPAVGAAALYMLKSRPGRLIICPRKVLAVWGGLKFIRQRFPLLR